MKVSKKIKNQDSKRRLNAVDFRNAKSVTWNSKRRFGI